MSEIQVNDFQVGDRVRRRRHRQTIEGTVRYIDARGRVYIRWDRGSWRETAVRPQDLVLRVRPAVTNAD